jgi:tRNA(Ile)-lysidine synthase
MTTNGAKKRMDAAVDRLVRRVEAARDAYGLLVAGGRVLAAVSGGPDSTALLHVLADSSARWGLSLGVAHVHHGLRPEADGDAEFVRGLAAALGLPFHLAHADVRAHRRRAGLCLEEAARELRYRFLEAAAAAGGYTQIALGHHADDNAETLLLNLLRGGGRRGLAGIPPFRPPHYVRPLILARRAEILAYLDCRRIPFRTDRTNADAAFDRNRIRLQVIPELERALNPRVREALGRTAEILGAEEAWLESLTASMFAAARRSRPGGGLALREDALREAPPAARRRIVRRALAEAGGGLRGIGFTHVEQIMGLLGGRRDAGPLHLPRGVRVRRRAGMLEFYRRPDGGEAADVPDYGYTLERPGVLDIPPAGVRMVLTELCGAVPADIAAASPDIAFLDGDGVSFPVTVRNFRPGDRFHPLGAAGTQKLKKFFRDHQVPRDRRRRLPLLISAGRIVWVAGLRPDERVRVTARSRRVIKAEVLVAPG